MMATLLTLGETCYSEDTAFTGYTTGDVNETTFDPDNNYYLGGPTDTWGHTWTPSQLSNANFRVRLTGATTWDDPENDDVVRIRIDWIPVRVYYTERGDITIRKEAAPHPRSQDFHFTGDLGAFTLDDDPGSGTPQQITFGNQPVGTYDVTEAVPPNWELVAINCDDGNSTGNVGTHTATIKLEADEHVTCIFVDTFSPPPPAPPSGVGGELYPVDKLGIVAPWLALALLLALGGGFVVMRRRQAH